MHHDDTAPEPPAARRAAACDVEYAPLRSRPSTSRFRGSLIVYSGEHDDRLSRRARFPLFPSGRFLRPRLLPQCRAKARDEYPEISVMKMQR